MKRYVESLKPKMGRLTQLTDINETQTIETRRESIKNIVVKTLKEVIRKQ